MTILPISKTQKTFEKASLFIADVLENMVVFNNTNRNLINRLQEVKRVTHIFLENGILF